jgi:hypothetical protein
MYYIIKRKNNFLGLLIMSKPGKSLKALCKRLGVRLTVKRGKKRVYKSVAVLKRQCAKKKKKVKKKRKFGTSGTGDVNTAGTGDVNTEIITYRFSGEGIYTGQIKNGKKQGRGKMTYNNGDVYEGEWKDDKKQGLGKMTYNNGDVYEGQWIDNKKHGKGVMKYDEESMRNMSPYGYGELIDSAEVKLKSSFYNGDWKEDKRHGTGLQSFMDWDGDDYDYKGEWKNDKKHGKGRYTIGWYGYSYNGQWKDNNPNGFGTEGTRNYVYEGHWKDGKKHGKGKIEHKDDDVYNGEWKYGKKDGYGESLEVFGEGEDRYGNTVAKQLEYKGKWKDDEKHGQGVGKYTGYGFDWIKYKGPWKHDNEEGKGIMTWSSGRQYKGDFKKGKKYGYGVETKFGGEDPNLLFKGDWVKDALVNGDYHLYRDGVYEYTIYHSKQGPDGSVSIVKTVEDEYGEDEFEEEDLKGLKEFKKVRANFLREGFGKRRKKRKWSLKYKRSINCKRPKGFSQKQYCKRKMGFGKKVAIRTNEKLWRRIQQKYHKSNKGGKPGQWSARKAQLAVQEYKKKGGKYKGNTRKKTDLHKWTKEDWGTRSGKNSIQGKKATGERYLPRKAREALTKREYKRTTAAKRKGIKKGKQFVRQPKKIAKKTAKYRKRKK